MLTEISAKLRRTPEVRAGCNEATYLRYMRVLITAATTGEWMPCFLQMESLYTSESQRLKLRFHQSGVGMLASAVSLTKLVTEEKPDLLIQAGVAGCFDMNQELGKVVVIREEILGDMGVEEGGKWKDLFDLKLEKNNYHPFEHSALPNPWLVQYNLLQLPEVNAITVNEITTRAERVVQLRKKYKPVTESMEGAALHYVCRAANIPFLQIRAVSNYVGERDKSKWKLKLAIDQLNHTLLQYVAQLYEVK